MKLQTTKGIWFSLSFTKKFGSPDITPSKTVPPFKTLEKPMTDSEIQKEFGVQESTLGDVVAFLENPPEGADDGNWSMFYVASCVVNVRWGSDDREWYVSTWRLDEARWPAGSHAFGRNSSSDTVPSCGATVESLTLRLEKVEAVLEAVREALAV